MQPSRRFSDAPIVVGVLALQGAFASHVERLGTVGVAATEVRTPEQLKGVDALVMPGGESTTMSTLLGTTGLFAPIADRMEAGMPVFGTCAGMILLADKILDGRDDQVHFGALDITVRRNGYGRQVYSFETDLQLAGDDRPFHGVFIRAPRVEAVGPDVEVLATYDGDPVLVRQGTLLAACFHPELTDDTRLHESFVELILQTRRER